MKKIINSILAALFIMGSINVAMANDDNYHGSNDVAAAINNPTIILGLDSHTFGDDDYQGND